MPTDPPTTTGSAGQDRVTDSAAGLPLGYGATLATNGAGEELWRYLVCERCGSMVANDPRYVQLHDRFHGVKP